MLLKSQDMVRDNTGGGLSVSADPGVAACLSQHCSSCALGWGRGTPTPQLPLPAALPPAPPSSPTLRTRLAAFSQKICWALQKHLLM